MERNDLLNAIIDDGIHEIEKIYTRPEQKIKRDGGIRGFGDCRGKTDQELMILYRQARLQTSQAREAEDPNYFGAVMYERQIEWVLNVLSAGYREIGLAVLIPPTSRGLLKLANILEQERFDELFPMTG